VAIGQIVLLFGTRQSIAGKHSGSKPQIYDANVILLATFASTPTAISFAVNNFPEANAVSAREDFYL
jgi:hypothetical protein